MGETGKGKTLTPIFNDLRTLSDQQLINRHKAVVKDMQPKHAYPAPRPTGSMAAGARAVNIQEARANYAKNMQKLGEIKTEADRRISQSGKKGDSKELKQAFNPQAERIQEQKTQVQRVEPMKLKSRGYER